MLYNPQRYAIWGVFVALGFLMPLIGGIFADKILDFKRTIILGLVSLVISYIILLYGSHSMVYLGLAGIIIGTGLLKNNLSTLFGFQYDKKLQQKQKAYSVFFMAMTMGAVLDPLSFGLAGEQFGWGNMFIPALLLSFISLNLFIIFKSAIANVKMTKATNKKKLGYIAVPALILFFVMCFYYSGVSNQILAILIFAVLFIVNLWLIIAYKNDAKKILGLMLLNFILVVYYAASLQVNGSLVVGAAAHFKFYFFNWRIPSTTIASIEALSAFMLSPVVILFDEFLKKCNIVISIPLKIALGFLMTGISFLFFALTFSSFMFPLLSLILGGIFVGLSAAVLICPTQMTAVSMYAPTKTIGTLMGVTFAFTAIAGYLGTLLSPLNYTATTTVLSYHEQYTHIAVYMIIMSILLLILTPIIQSLFVKNDLKEAH